MEPAPSGEVEEVEEEVEVEDLDWAQEENVYAQTVVR